MTIEEEIQKLRRYVQVMEQTLFGYTISAVEIRHDIKKIEYDARRNS